MRVSWRRLSRGGCSQGGCRLAGRRRCIGQAARLAYEMRQLDLSKQCVDYPTLILGAAEMYDYRYLQHRVFGAVDFH